MYKEKMDLIKNKKIKDFNNKEYNNLIYWQIEKYHFFLSKGKKDINVNTIKNLINIERKLKALYILWITQIETKLKTVFEEILMQYGRRSDQYQIEFYAKNYRNKTINKKILKILKKAKKDYKKSNGQSNDYYLSKLGYLPLNLYVKYVGFNDIIFIVKHLNLNLKVKILNKMRINEKFISCLEILREVRNISAHDNSLLDYQSDSYALPKNIISSAIASVVNLSQKRDNLWNRNLISALISIKLFLTKNQFNNFAKEYKNIVINLSKKLGYDNIIYYRLLGGSMKSLNIITKINSPKLMKHNHIATYNLKKLRAYYKDMTGNYKHFKSRDKAIEQIIEIFRY